MSIAVKDLCWTRDMPTAAGMMIYKDFRPAEDAAVVRKLYSARAIILGKLQMTEGAYANHHPLIPPPVNPWNPEHWPGVSFERVRGGDRRGALLRLARH